MYFCNIIDGGQPICLYSGNKENFVIIKNNRDIYEVITNSMSNEDARDICMQEDNTIAKMMLELRISGKIGAKNNILGDEVRIMSLMNNKPEVKQTMSRLKDMEKGIMTEGIA